MKEFNVQPGGIYAIYKDWNSQSTVVTICTTTIYIKNPWVILPQIVSKRSECFTK